MVHICKKNLNHQDIKKMSFLLHNIIAHDYNFDEFEQIINDIITPTEKIMLVKRIFILYLLYNNVSQKEIAKAVKVSTSTVSRYGIIINNSSDKFKNIMSNIEKKEKLINIIDDLFHQLFISPGIYKNHWKMYSEYLKRKEKRKTLGL